MKEEAMRALLDKREAQFGRECTFKPIINKYPPNTRHEDAFTRLSRCPHLHPLHVYHYSMATLTPTCAGLHPTTPSPPPTPHRPRPTAGILFYLWYEKS